TAHPPAERNGAPVLSETDQTQTWRARSWVTGKSRLVTCLLDGRPGVVAAREVVGLELGQALGGPLVLRLERNALPRRSAKIRLTLGGSAKRTRPMSCVTNR